MASNTDPLPELGPSLVAELRQRLEARRTDLDRLIAQGRRDDAPVAPDKAIGRLTRQDALQQQEMSAALVRRYEQELSRVQQALRAADDGTYGFCRRCEEPIAPARLLAMPDAVLCVGCADRSGDRP
jgi:DnaK suppressor protein